jgi:tetraacyldisaccharide 4'-kinase
METLREVIWAQRGTVGRLGSLALRPLSGLFRLGVGARNLGYRVGLLRARRAPMPIVSVGNLVVGGTGKTPFTLWLSRSLTERGLRVGILLRGYRGTSKGVAIVSRGQGPELEPAVAGDEAVMLAKSFTGPVVTAARRVDGAAALAELGCDVVVLDDGFQHRAIERVFDIVLVDERTGPLLPAGPAREAPSALRRADAVLLVSRGEAAGPAEAPRSAAGKHVHRVRFEASELIEAAGSQWRKVPLGSLAGRRVVAVLGVAKPDSFYDLLRAWDATIEDVFEFPDHHRYTRADWQNISRSGLQADLVVTTEKDLVKLGEFPFATGKLVALRIVPYVERSEELIEAVLARVERPTPLGGMA